MKLRDKNLRVAVDVSDDQCLRRVCYWPRKDPGSFTLGVGYRYRSDPWLCGNREIRMPVPEAGTDRSTEANRKGDPMKRITLFLWSAESDWR